MMPFPHLGSQRGTGLGQLVHASASEGLSWPAEPQLHWWEMGGGSKPFCYPCTASLSHITRAPPSAMCHGKNDHCCQGYHLLCSQMTSRVYLLLTSPSWAWGPSPACVLTGPHWLSAFPLDRTWPLWCAELSGKPRPQDVRGRLSCIRGNRLVWLHPLLSLLLERLRVMGVCVCVACLCVV
jgi:hypothetical protein